MKEAYTTEEAAGALGVSSARVRQLILEGVLTTERFGRAHVITREALEAARQRQTTPGPPPRPKDNDQKADREAMKRKALARWEGEGGKTAPAKKAAKKKGK
jgi:excisionase family DNA binding protein